MNNRRRRFGVGEIDQAIKTPDGYVNLTRLQKGMEHIQAMIDDVNAKSHELQEDELTKYLADEFGTYWYRRRSSTGRNVSISS